MKLTLYVNDSHPIWDMIHSAVYGAMEDSRHMPNPQEKRTVVTIDADVPTFLFGDANFPGPLLARHTKKPKRKK